MTAGATYDAGVLIAVERHDRRTAARHRELTARGVVPSVPATVLAQVWRGGPQAEVSRLLRGCKVVAVTEDEARRAGAALARSRTTDIVDATVVVGALERRESVVTGDPADIAEIVAALGRHLIVRTV